MQQAVETFPVIVQCRGVGSRPSLDLFDQCHTLSAVLGRLCFDLLEPDFDDLVGLIAGIVKLLPKAVVGHAALVCFLPLLTQSAQAFLHLASPHGLAVGAFQQTLCFGNQIFTHLVRAPTLPPFELAGRCQRRVRLVLQLGVDDFAKFFERVAQRRCSASTGFAMAFSHFLLYFCERVTHHRCGLGLDFGV